MLNIKQFEVNMLSENCYVVSDETKECVIIDCGCFADDERKELVDYIRSNELKPVHLLATHGHFDHNFGIDTIYSEFGLKVEAHKSEASLISNLKKQAEDLFGVILADEQPPVGRYFNSGEEITFGSHKLKVIHTPGHTMGSVTFHCEDEKVMFSGDTLFRQSIGRTDMPGGSMFMIINSLRYLCQLSDDIEVYPGHGPKTTIGYELAHNPYLDR